MLLSPMRSMRSPSRRPNSAAASMTLLRSSCKTNTKQSQSVQVAARIRPLNTNEKTLGGSILNVKENTIYQTMPDGEHIDGRHDVYNYKHVYDTQSTTDDVYNGVCSPLFKMYYRV